MNDLNHVNSSIYDFFEVKPRKGDLKKMEILLAAIDCIADIGFEKTTYEAIARKIGTRRAHVAYHFRDKSDIFEACIRYIHASYQQKSIEHLETARDDEDMLFKYIEAPFYWAIENPKQLSVMLLFYYLCRVDNKYLELHTELRQNGFERIQYILTNKVKLHVDKSTPLAKAIQNLMSGFILDAGTTTNKELEEALEESKATINQMIEHAKTERV